LHGPHPLAERASRRRSHIIALLWLAFVVCIAPLAAVQAQEGGDETPEYTALTVPLPAEGESQQAFRVVVGGRDATGFASQSRAELELAVAPMPADEIAGRVDAALGYLETVASALGRVLIRHARLEAGDADVDAMAELVERAELIAQFKDSLIARANILIEAGQDKGIALDTQKAYVAVVSTMVLPEVPGAEEVPTASQLAQDTIRQVREEPPVHERSKPWTVPTDELTLELQPLRREQIEERVDAWLQILQRQVRERIRIDIALNNKTEDQAQKEVLAAMANEQQQVITATVERLQAALTVLAKRGGDTSVASQYIANATGQRIDVTDPAVFYAQAKAWAFSPNGGVKVLVNLLKFIAIVAFFWLISGVVGVIIGSGLKRLPRASSLLHQFLVGGSRRVVMLIGLIVAVSSLGISITPLAAAIGAAGLVVGLALQGTLSNFASGILILIYRPFDIGDVINAGGVFGKVDAMTLVSTRVLTFDNQVNWVPNNSIWNNVITNATALDTRRVDMVFGIGYADDMAKAQAIIEECVSSHPKVLETPAPTIKVNELGDNSVNFIVRPWSRTSEYWDVYWDLIRQVKERFDAEGINIPFPQRDLHLSGPIEVVMKPDRKAPEPPPPPAPAPTTEPSESPSTNEPGPAPE
jgi:small conductance mechanosensitive channel